ncbi:Hsp20/alpha crystallin family protein [Cribrihabitans neustonicus]|uniref:Hsp20/alpha crystallin family protein n=1 Tax=Cribrihabitans neustonicus TaxID=1429085 RepID=UPI003B5A63B1
MPDKPEDTRPEAPRNEDTGSPEKALAERSWGPLWNIREEIDDLLEDLHSGSFFAPLRPRSRRRRSPLRWPLQEFSWKMPVLDVVDKEDELKLTAELPGLSEKDIDLRVGDGTLTLRGEKKHDHEEGDKEGGFYLSERRFGAFERTIGIPEGIDRDKIEATFKNGVLTVRLPKKPEARNPTRKIDVKSAS